MSTNIQQESSEDAKIEEGAKRVHKTDEMACGDTSSSNDATPNE